MHIVAKVFAKALSLRLAPKLDHLVSRNQNAFILRRSLHDNFILVRQSLKMLHQLGAPRIMLKLDLTRAFDSLSWPFLFEVLRKYGFGDRFREWMAILLSSASTRVMINGVPGPPIWHRRGLRQGDSTSPQLFVLAVDTLGRLMRHALQTGILQQLHPRRAIPAISLYADDVMMFCHATTEEIAAVKGILDVFGTASGLRVNYAKSSATILHAGDYGEGLLEPLGCPVVALPVTYLGIPLSTRRPSAAQLQPLVAAVAGRLPSWKAWLMNKAGRLALVKSVLNAIPIHQLLALAPPKKTLKQLEKIQRGFLWAGRADAHGGHCHVTGAGFAARLNMAALASGTSSARGYHFGCAGYGSRARTLLEPGRGWTRNLRRRSVRSFTPPRLWQLEMAGQPCSGRIAGLVANPSASLRRGSSSASPSNVKNLERWRRPWPAIVGHVTSMAC